MTGSKKNKLFLLNISFQKMIIVCNQKQDCSNTENILKFRVNVTLKIYSNSLCKIDY
jgi:hypothetical protein